MKWFCQHDYVIIKEIEMKSRLDIIRENCREIPSHAIWDDCALMRKHIIIFKCSKCNKIKKDVNYTC
jgi:hypothetical protein